MKLKNLLLGSMAGLLIATSALAQVNTVPQVGVISNIIRNPTYTASAVGLVPAASATDIFCIAPGVSRTISVRRISISGTAGTAITTPFLIYRRATVDTGGTAATGLALPVGVPQSTIDQASTATLISYTANPTVTDSSPALLSDMLVDLAVTTASGGDITNVQTWGTSIDLFQKGLSLQKNTTQQLCIALNGVSVSSGVLQISMDWQEVN